MTDPLEPYQAAKTLRRFIGPKGVVEVWPRKLGGGWTLLVSIDSNTSYATFDVPSEWRGYTVQRTYWVEPAS